MNLVSKTSFVRIFDSISTAFPGVYDQLDTIWTLAYNDMKTQRRFLREWILATKFHPSPDFPPIRVPWSIPVHEYTCYHNKLYYRKRHSLGVTLACKTSSSPYIVVWTLDLKAYIYRLSDGIWKRFKILYNQKDPFDTWMKHLGGQKLVSTEPRTITWRSPRQLFFNDMVPYYGSHKLLRDLMDIRLDHKHIIWDIIQEVSYIFSIHPSLRMRWSLCLPQHIFSESC